MNAKGIFLGLLLALSVQVTGADRGLSFDFQKHPERAASVYFAPENMLIWRLRTPGGGMREFEIDYSKLGTMRSVGGWSARFGAWPITYESGSLTAILSSPDTNDVRLAMKFDNGRLVAFKEGDVFREFPRDAVRPLLKEEESPLLASGYKGENTALIEEVSRQFSKKWKKSGRLAFPWNNPNRNAALWGELAILLLGFALFIRGRRPVGLAIAAFGAIAAVMCVMCGSRGAILGIVLAIFACAAARSKETLKLFRSKWFLVCTGIVLLAFVTWALTTHTRFLTRGGSGFGTGGWSNHLRVAIWKSAPLMFVDAPCGWGWFDAAVGHAYFNWYQPLQVTALTGSLISDHLTRLAAVGWTFRGIYLAAWLFITIIAFLRVRKGDLMPLVMTVFFAVTAWFNPIFAEPILWVLFAAAWIPTLMNIRGFRVKPMVIALAASLSLGSAATLSLYVIGDNMKRDFVRVHVSEGARQTLVNGINPRVWVVDDLCEPFGSTLACKDIRWHYFRNPQSPAIGYVTDVGNLPASGIDRLVLGGKSGDAWLKLVCSSEEARAKLPGEVIFISPPFPPDAIPPPLFSACKVRFVIGEFAADYQPKLYKAPPDFVEIVPGMELYIANWMDFAVGK